MLGFRLNRASFWVLFIPANFAPHVLEAIGIASLLGWIPLAAVCLGRLHDVGLTGRWVLIPLILQIVCTLLVFAYIPEHQWSTGLYAISAATILALLWLGSEPGEPISNAWGGPQGAGLSFGKSK